MKRADTGAANFTTISWGEDILEMVGYDPTVYFSEAIEEAEQGTQNISPSQAASLESQGQFSSGGKYSKDASKGIAVSKVGRAIFLETGNIAGPQQEASPEKISETTAGLAGEPTTIRVPPSRPTPRRR
jgi:hypothetical protein